MSNHWCPFVKVYFEIHIRSFSVQVYSNLEGNRSHVVNTGWAVLALIDAGQVHKIPINYTFSILMQLV